MIALIWLRLLNGIMLVPMLPVLMPLIGGAVVVDEQHEKMLKTSSMRAR